MKISMCKYIPGFFFLSLSPSQTYIAFAEIQLPEDVNARGVCGKNTSQLLLEWGNNTFHVNFTFTLNVSETLTLNFSLLVCHFILHKKFVNTEFKEKRFTTKHTNVFSKKYSSRIKISFLVLKLDENSYNVTFHRAL